jgi:hypothetical protein
MSRHLYRIMLNAELRSSDRDWLADLSVEPSTGHRTVLRGALDQSGLFGVLSLCAFLGLEVFEVRRVCGCVGRRESCEVDARRLVST